MSLANNEVSQDRAAGGAHRNTIPLGVPGEGEHVFSVSRGKRYIVNVGNPGGSTFDLIFYNFTEKEDALDGVTRVKGVDQAGITATNFNKASVIGFAEVGIEVTASSGSPVTLEVIECKL